MKTTLTREAILEKGKPRYEVVEVEGWGKLGLRSVSVLQRSRRASRMWDSDGNFNEQLASMRQVHAVIDQVMVDEQTPMFTEADAAALGELDPLAFDQIYAAILAFNGEDDDPGKKDASSD